MTLISSTKKTRLTKIAMMIGAMNRVKNGMLLARMKHMVSARYPWSVKVKLPTVYFRVKTKYPIRGSGIGRPKMKYHLLIYTGVKTTNTL